MKESVFKAYDIRGTVGKDFLLESVSDLGYAISYFLKNHYPHVKNMVIGRDARVTSEKIQQDIMNSLINSGFSVFDICLVPSPVVYFAVHTGAYDAGIIITASHNKKEDNGIKINIGKNAITSLEIQEIKKYYNQKKSLFSEVKGIVQHYDIIPEYISYLKKLFPELINSSLSFVVDCGNGTSGVVMPRLIEEMKLKNAKILCATVDGNFPNHDANPTKIENMQDVLHELKTGKFELGIGIDGDSDRMAAITKSGVLLSGDILLTIFVQDLLKNRPNVTAVCNVLGSDILMQFLQKKGATVIMVPVGNGIMRAEVKKHHAQLGAEVSGHLFFSDHYFGFDDGIYVALRLISLLQNSKKTLDEFVQELPQRYTSLELRISCSPEEKNKSIQDAIDYFQKQNCSLLLIDGIRAQFEYGWILIRPSNTENLLSIRFEGTTKENYEILKKHLSTCLPLYFTEFIKNA